MPPEDLFSRRLLAAQFLGGLVRCFGLRHRYENFEVPSEKARHAENRNLESRSGTRAE